MNLKAGKSIIRWNVIGGVAAFVTFGVALAWPTWAWVPAAAGCLSGAMLFRAHVRLARMFAGIDG